MSALAAVDRVLSALCARVGRAVSWLVVGMVALTFAVVVLRYGFNFGRIYLQELITYMHAAVFMLAAAWTLQQDGHVRVDAFYRRMPPRRQAWINLLGSLLLLLPAAGALLWLSHHYVEQAWELREGSREADGLPFLYVLKTVIPLAAGLLVLQGIAAACRHLRELLERRP